MKIKSSYNSDKEIVGELLPSRTAMKLLMKTSGLLAQCTALTVAQERN